MVSNRRLIEPRSSLISTALIIRHNVGDCSSADWSISAREIERIKRSRHPSCNAKLQQTSQICMFNNNIDLSHP